MLVLQALPVLGNHSKQKEAKSTKRRVMEYEKATACGTHSREELFTSWLLARAR